MRSFNTLICCLVMSGMIAANFSSSAEAATPDRPKEMNNTYEFSAKDMNGLGAGMNSDITRLGRLFGALSEIDVSRTHRIEVQGWLGIVMKIPTRLPKEPGTDQILQAIEVARIMPDSGAHAAGLREGDLIVGLDGEPVEDKGGKALRSIRVAVSKKHIGESLRLRIFRDDAFLELDATINPHPRVEPVIKPHPELEEKLSRNGKSLLSEVLEKKGLTDEYVRLVRAFQNETGKVVSPLINQKGYNSFRLQEVNYAMYNPLNLPVVARHVTDGVSRAFNKTHHDLEALMQVAMDELDMAYNPEKHGGNKPVSDFDEYIERLLMAIQNAKSERAEVLSVLDDEEIDFLYRTAPKFLEGESDAVKKEKTIAEMREEDARLLHFFQLVLKLDISRLLNAAGAVAQALDLETLATLEVKTGKLQRSLQGRIVRQDNNLTVIDTPAGRVLIGGSKGNTYTEDAVLIVDFGGSDIYLNHAGSSTRNNPFSVVIDLSGDDVYSAKEDFAQGAGLIGGGFLIDLKGNDRYLAKNHSQGAGILGVGILSDLAGRDQYTAITASQGAGSFGIGVLAEGGGDDTYFGNYFVQGVGDTGGIGIIVDVTGNDNYFAGGLYEDIRAPGKSYQSMSQGFGYGMRPWESVVGASGGIGVIAEAEGNDTYVADYFAQGSSYWFSLGILDDRKGNDRYISGRYSQGAGIHMSAGVLIDGEGDDNYLADFGVAQGCGHDFGIGFLLDNGGSDRYNAGAIAQGVGNENGIGVLSDNGGDDEYFLKNLGQGHGNFVPERGEGSFGFLFDTGGNDVYTQGGKNNSLSYKSQWGILVDTN